MVSPVSGEASSAACATPTGRPWTREGPAPGRLFLVSDNPVSRALVRLAEIVDRPVTSLGDDAALAALRAAGLGAADAMVLCDHDTPDHDAILDLALTRAVGYVAMLGSRPRAELTYTDLQRRHDAAALSRLHVPAGLDLGGKQPGEIALSIIAEVVATGYRKSGGPMRRRD